MGKRVYAFDILRGGMIFYIILLHAMLQRVYSSKGSQFEVVVNEIPLAVAILISPLILFSLWGTLFTFITGASSTYSITSQSVDQENAIGSAVKKRFYSALVLQFIAIIDIYFFAARVLTHPDLTFSMFTGTLEQGHFIIPEFIHFFTATTLQSIATTSMLVSGLMYFFYKKRTSHWRMVGIFLGVGIGVLVLTYFFRIATPNPDIVKESILAEKNYIIYWLYVQLFASRFALFPVFAFGCFGSAFGILVGHRESYKKILTLALILTGGFLGLFLWSFLKGFNVIGNFALEIVPLPLQFLNIGLQILFLVILLRIFDYRNNQLSSKGQKFIKVIRRYSSLSLTIYILEKLISSAWYKLFVYLNHGAFSENLAVMLLFYQCVIITWWFITKWWEKIGFKGSFEWLISTGHKWLLKHFGNPPVRTAVHLTRELTKNEKKYLLSE